jgi:hypothetical protein
MPCGYFTICRISSADNRRKDEIGAVETAASNIIFRPVLRPEWGREKDASLEIVL